MYRSSEKNETTRYPTRNAATARWSHDLVSENDLSRSAFPIHAMIATIVRMARSVCLFSSMMSSVIGRNQIGMSAASPKTQTSIVLPRMRETKRAAFLSAAAPGVMVSDIYKDGD